MNSSNGNDFVMEDGDNKSRKRSNSVVQSGASSGSTGGFDNKLSAPSQEPDDTRAGNSPGAYRAAPGRIPVAVLRDDPRLPGQDDDCDVSGDENSSSTGRETDFPRAHSVQLVIGRGIPIEDDQQRGQPHPSLIFYGSFACIVVVIMIIAVPVSLTQGDRDGPTLSDISVTLAPTLSPASPTLAPTYPSRCFPHRDALLAAVDSYVQDPSDRTSEVATTYGWPIGSWCVSRVQDFEGVFSNSRNPAMGTFNTDLSGWDTSSAVSMASIFMGASAFNGDITTWDTSKVTDMTLMFSTARAFNQDIGNWTVSNVESMSRMFLTAATFNADISQWDVSSVTNMNTMFGSAFAFNQNLCAWGSILSNTSVFVEGMFEGTNCPVKDDPVLTGGSAWCSECNGRFR